MILVVAWLLTMHYADTHAFAYSAGVLPTQHECEVAGDMLERQSGLSQRIYPVCRPIGEGSQR